jgi:uncharacterized protein
MRIEVESLEKPGDLSQVYEVDSLSLDEELRLLEPVEVRGRARRSGAEVELSGELRTSIEVPCSRCLKPVILPIRSEFAERFVPAVAWRNEEQHELREADLDLAIFDGDAIELDDVVREEILLALPSHVVCREDCKGLCPGCGTDRNVGSCTCENKEIDSRWEGLKEIRF